MLRSATSNCGQLYCGGMVSIIAERLGLHLPNNPTNIVIGHTHLSIDVMETMHLFHRLPTGDVHWIVDGKEYLHIDSRNKKILNLANDIPSTTWKLRSNLGVTVDHSPPPSPPPAPTAGASSSSRPIPFSEHHLYMGETTVTCKKSIGPNKSCGGLNRIKDGPLKSSTTATFIICLSDIHRVIVLHTEPHQPSASQPQ
ncbi:unnamed protein product [Lactuca saligna]|uniref:Uncharacterized protein n=1 Tax=Lactuca saligna TaxID=75948 RepID=A0AA35UT92_LACSI|nr:unnamed protein product [Lactuca saligna]